VDYLAYRGESNLYVVQDSLRTEPEGRGQGLRVNFARPGFVIGPVEAKGFDPGTMGGMRVRETWFVGEEAGDSLDVRVGRYLVSLDRQDEKTGRVLAYDPDLLASFPGFDVFPERRRYRVKARVSPADGAEIEVGTSRGLAKNLVRAARLDFELRGRPARLYGFREPGEEEGALFVPFRDGTSGGSSYGLGRYLRVEPGEDGWAVVDFNRATNPWCAYSEFYNCVLPPPENELAVEVPAGEKAPAGH
jgi:hypothetical protein